jgi:hypothetical protein
MFELYYADGLGGIVQVATFADKQSCLDKAAADGKTEYTIEFEVAGVVMLVESC